MAGLNRFRFKAKLGRKRLRPGRYVLIAKPKGGKPRSRSFRVKR